MAKSTIAAVFLDTNYFYYYNAIPTIDWPVELRSESVELVVAPVIIRELNDHKDGGRHPRVIDRAEEALRVIGDILDAHHWKSPAPIREKTFLTVQTADAPLTAALSASVNDDQLLANALTYRDIHPSAEVVILSGDVGLRLKSFNAGHRNPHSARGPKEDAARGSPGQTSEGVRSGDQRLPAYSR